MVGKYLKWYEKEYERIRGDEGTLYIVLKRLRIIFS